MSRTFPDPNQKFRHETITSPFTQMEALVIDTYDPTSPNRINNTAGFLVRTAIDLARYRRSAETHPDRREHYARMTRTAIYAANSRVQPWNFPQSTDLSYVDAIQHDISQLPWEKVPETFVPTVARTAPYSGSEQPVWVQFKPQTSSGWSEMPA